MIEARLLHRRAEQSCAVPLHAVGPRKLVRRSSSLLLPSGEPRCCAYDVKPVRTNKHSAGGDIVPCLQLPQPSE
eukprot:scaffold53565_cov29-Tisochrysis_lutea.AAC.3